MNWWTVPRMWEGQTVAIMASGGSMSADVAETVRQSGVPSIAINDTYKLASWANLLYAADVGWWGANPAALALPATKVCCIGDGKQAPPAGVNCLRMTGTAGLETDPSAVRTGCNSGYQAVQVAFHAGAARILLCGYNYGGPNWHGKHKAPLRNTSDGAYVTWRRLFEQLVREVEQRGTVIVNCTSNSSLYLPHVPLEEALASVVRDPA